MSDEPTEPLQSGLYCWIDQARQCSAECMAYTTSVQATQGTTISEQQQHCGLLSAAERAGRGIMIVAQQLIRADKRAQDQQIAPTGRFPQNPFNPQGKP